jgi:medium-chain acyl-[acyl-carrier-protein] hydrolase
MPAHTTRPVPLRVLARPPRSREHRRPLLCLTYAGGGSRSYESWQRLMPSSVDAQTLRLPGRETRSNEPLPDDLRTLAKEIAEELEPYVTDRFAVFGHSMGALLAYELTHAMRAAYGVEPRCLLVSGMRAPDQFGGPPRYAELDENDLRAAVATMGGTDPEVLVNPELWQLFVPIIRSDLAMCDAYRYVPAEPLRCPLVAYGARHDQDSDVMSLNRWGAHTTGPFHTRVLPGKHFYFHRWPEMLATDLINRLSCYLLDVHR